MTLQRRAMKRIWIKEPLAIYSTEEASGGLVIEDEKITELVSGGQKPSEEVDQVFDASNLVVLPGLINTHHHFYQTLSRSFPNALNQPLFAWLENLYPLWAELSVSDISISTRLALSELLLSGCTTTVDHHYLFSNELQNAIDAQVYEASDLGMRAVLCRGSMSLGVDQGGLPPSSVVQDEKIILADSERLIKTHHDSGEGSMLQIALAPCSPFSVTRQLMEATSEMASTYNVKVHTHLAETEDENAYCLDHYGMRPLDYLEDLNMLNNKIWLAHGIHFDKNEIARLGNAKVGVSHCPSSNMILSSGICPVFELEKAGVNIGLGVDGSSSNDSSNMIEELRMAMLLQRLKSGAQQISHLDAIRWATSGSAASIGRSDIGELSVGKQADIAMFSLKEPRFSGFSDALASLILSGAHKADFVVVAGNWVVENGELTGIDMEKMLADHQLAAKNLIKRYNEGC